MRLELIKVTLQVAFTFCKAEIPGIIDFTGGPGGQLFPYKSSKFFRNSNPHKISFFNARGLKLGHFDIFNMLFPFLAFLKLQLII